MLKIPKILLLLSFIHLSTSAPCSFWEKFISNARCESFLQNYNGYIRKKDSGLIHEYAAKLCGQALDCLSSYNCDEINFKRIDLIPNCELSIYASYQNEQCLRGFFRKAYVAQFSNKHSCFKEFQFVHKDLTKQREAFIEGRECFFNYILEQCNSNSVDGKDSFNYFQDNYNQFVDSVTHEPAAEGCAGPRDLLNVIYCTSLADELEDRSDKLEEINERFNRRYLDNTLRVCRDAKACIDNSCILKKDLKLRREYERKCSRLEFKN